MELEYYGELNKEIELIIEAKIANPARPILEIKAISVIFKSDLTDLIYEVGDYSGLQVKLLTVTMKNIYFFWGL